MHLRSLHSGTAACLVQQLFNLKLLRNVAIKKIAYRSLDGARAQAFAVPMPPVLAGTGLRTRVRESRLKMTDVLRCTCLRTRRPQLGVKNNNDSLSKGTQYKTVAE